MVIRYRAEHPWSCIIQPRTHVEALSSGVPMIDGASHPAARGASTSHACSIARRANQ